MATNLVSIYIHTHLRYANRGLKSPNNNSKPYGIRTYVPLISSINCIVQYIGYWYLHYIIHKTQCRVHFNYFYQKHDDCWHTGREDTECAHNSLVFFLFIKIHNVCVIKIKTPASKIPFSLSCTLYSIDKTISTIKNEKKR